MNRLLTHPTPFAPLTPPRHYAMQGFTKHAQYLKDFIHVPRIGPRLTAIQVRRDTVVFRCFLHNNRSKKQLYTCVMSSKSGQSLP